MNYLCGRKYLATMLEKALFLWKQIVKSAPIFNIPNKLRDNHVSFIILIKTFVDYDYL